MELRPMQTALLAGRAASRWATSTSTTASKHSLPLSIYSSPFYRSFSSTRAALQEAEAPAPLPSGGMAGYFSKQRAQQQQQRQGQQGQQGQQPQNQQSTSPSLSPQPQRNSIFPDSPSDLNRPWATRPSNAQVVPTRARGKSNDVIGDLGLSDYLHPDLTDLEKSNKGPYYERPIDVKYRLRPVIGRTVELSTGNDNSARNLDFAKALARLDMNIRVNRVAQDLRRQRFHERNGLKKKRLRSERWRRRFMDGFKATCKRVTELAKQGW